VRQLTIQVKDANGQTASRSYTITIQDLAAVQLQEVPSQVAANTHNPGLSQFSKTTSGD
jgi:hypothetical protein